MASSDRPLRNLSSSPGVDYCSTFKNCTQHSNGTQNVLNIVEMMGEVLIGILAIFGNGLVLVAIASVPSLQTVTNFFVASLAAADLLVGLIGIPCVITAFNGLPTNFVGCLIVNSIIIVLTQISIFGLLVVAFERFYAIRYPYNYYHHCTTRTTVITISLTWMAGLIVGLVPIFGWNRGKASDFAEGSECTFTGVIEMEYMVYMNFFGFVLPPLVAMFALYGYIYTVVRYQIRKMCTIQPLRQSSASNALLFSASCPSISQTLQNSVRRREEVPLKKLRNGEVGQRSPSEKEAPGRGQTNSDATTDNGKLSQNGSPQKENGIQHNNGSHSDIAAGDEQEMTKCAAIARMESSSESASPASSVSATPNISAANEFRNRSASTTATLTTTVSRKIASSWKREIRAAKWFSVVLSVFAVCWLPLHVMNCITVFRGVTCTPCVTAAVILSHSNSAVNPVLYAYSNSKFYSTFRRMFHLRVSASADDSTF